MKRLEGAQAEHGLARSYATSQPQLLEHQVILITPPSLNPPQPAHLSLDSVIEARRKLGGQTDIMLVAVGELTLSTKLSQLCSPIYSQ